MAHTLDQREFVERLDPKGMYALTEAFADQCRKALQLSRDSQIEPLEVAPQLAVLTGLGGSAAGGDIVRALFEAHGSIPFLVNRDYHLPSYINKDCLVFAASYSGNTEETLSAYAEAKSKGCRVICVTSGGKLAELAKENGDDLILIPGGQPPRTALGFMLIPVVDACVRLGLLPAQEFERAFSLLDSNCSEWGVSNAFETNDAKQLAEFLYGSVSVLYGVGPWQGLVANRWKGQINENAKNMTFANTFPELNHNEILGWAKCETQLVPKWTAIYLQDGSESEKMKARARVTSEVIASAAEVRTATAKGGSLFEKILSLTYMGDFVSLYLAALNGVDPENIDAINLLKSELAQVPG